MEKKQEQEDNHEDKLVAVIVGIGGYKALRPLYCPVNDAVSLSETFKKGWPVCEITPLVWPPVEAALAQEKAWGIRLPEDAGQVTRQSILEKVRESAAKCEETDTFIFYFSGHGVFMDEEPALITVADGKTAEGTAYIKIHDLQQAASASTCRKKIMILDCCQDIKDRRAAREGYKRLHDIRADWWIFLSCSPGERSLEDQYEGKSSDDYKQQGIFTASLVERLRGEAGGGEDGITLVQLASYVGERVPIMYQEKLMTQILNKGEKTAAEGEGHISQNPVLIGPGFAVSGPYHVMMAPRRVPLCQKSRESLPGKAFFRDWYRFFRGQWPVLFPLKQGFRIGGGLLYAALMVLTVTWHAAQVKPTFSYILFLSAAGIGSLVIWWLSIALAVTVNEHRWFVGGYGTLLFFLIWHGTICLWFWGWYGAELHPYNHIAKINFLVSDLFYLFIGLIIFACNTSQTVIAIAEPLRQENERRDIRQAIRVFEEFKNKTFNASLYNYVPMVSAQPRVYYWIFAAILVLVGGITFQDMAKAGTALFTLWVLLVRNLLSLALVGWLLIWYASAFSFLQKEVYKR